MEIRISSPKHYESMYGESELVHAYLDRIANTVGGYLSSDVIDILRISLLIAHPEELIQGKFLEFEKYDWRCKYIAVGVNGNFERYHLGDDSQKISELAEMLLVGFMRVSKKRKAKFDYSLAKGIVNRTTNDFIDTFLK